MTNRTNLKYDLNTEQQPTDSWLVAELRCGNIDAFEEIYNRYCAKVYNYINRMLGDAVRSEDFTQNVFLKLWEKREYLDETRNIASYIFTISKHLVYKQTEKIVLHGKYVSTTLQNLTEMDNSSEEELNAIFTVSYLMDIIVKLPASRREIFILSRLEGLSNREIASRLGISVKTVETQIYRATNFIKKFKSTIDRI